MKRHYFSILLVAFIFLGFTKDKPAYLLYDKDGKQVKYATMIKAFEDADIIFFGELHTDPIAHWMQLELAMELFDMKQEDLILGAEMFEADNQLVLDEYLDGRYPDDKFEVELKLWNNYKTDYKPLVEFARENGIPFVATNIPRRYASMVHKGDFAALDSLSDEAKRYIAPLPILYDPELRCYKEMLEMPSMKPEKPAMDTAMAPVHTLPDTTANKPGGEQDDPQEKAPMHGGGMPMAEMMNLPKAQAAKDATMAYFIMKNWEDGKTLFHLNGSYHSNNYQGIVWHLLQQKSDLKIVTIATVLQEDIEKLEEENLNIADFILCIPETMTRTNR